MSAASTISKREIYTREFNPTANSPQPGSPIAAISLFDPHSRNHSLLEGNESLIYLKREKKKEKKQADSPRGRNLIGQCAAIHRRNIVDFEDYSTARRALRCTQ
jgi:hypothetical protein